MAARQERSKPISKQLEIRLKASRARVSAKSLLGNAPKYIAKFRGGLCLFRTAGRVELDNNSIQRPIVLNRQNALFARHDAGAQNRAMLASLIETCKLNAVDLQAWLDTYASGHRQRTQTIPDRRTATPEFPNKRVSRTRLTIGGACS